MEINIESIENDVPKLSKESVAQYLLEHKYFLTALEFDFEHIERGYELQILRNYFSNPDNFDCLKKNEVQEQRLRPSPSVSTLDSLDFAKFSDDGTQLMDEKVKVLEFELRKKTDEVRKLRDELTKVTTSNSTVLANEEPSTTNGEQSLSNNKTLGAFAGIFVNHVNPNQYSSCKDGDSRSVQILAHEQRAMNFLVNEYLLQYGYKLTAISFSEENSEQDVDSWDDVGLNIPKPPSLFHVLQVYHRGVYPAASYHQPPENSLTVETEEKFSQTSAEHDIAMKEHLSDLKEELEGKTILIQDLEKTKTRLSEEALNLRRELNDAKSRLICLDRENRERSESIRPAGSSIHSLEDSSQSTHPDLNSTSAQQLAERTSPEGEEDLITKKRRVSPEFMTHLSILSNFEENGASIPLAANLDDMISLVANQLPLILQHLPKDQRNVVMPLLVHAICLHRNPQHREKLLNSLFNLSKRPSSEERLLVLHQCKILATYLGAYRVESEFLPQIWEELSVRPKPSAERRQLIAEICGVIAPLAPAPLRSSLMLSVLQQILEEENEPLVRTQVIHSMAILAALIEDEDKLPTFINILHNLTPTSLTTNPLASYELLLASLCQWCLETEQLHHLLIDSIIAKMEKCLPKSSIGQRDTTACIHIQSLIQIVPFIFVWVIATVPAVPATWHRNKIEPNQMTDPLFENSPNFRPSVILGKVDFHRSYSKYLDYVAFRSSLNHLEPSELADIPEANDVWTGAKWLASELAAKFCYVLKQIFPTTADSGTESETALNDQYLLNAEAGLPQSGVMVCRDVCLLLYKLSAALGKEVVEWFVIPAFSRELYSYTELGNCDFNSNTMTTGVFAGFCCVLASSNQKSDLIKLQKMFTSSVFLLTSEGKSLDGLRHTVIHLCYVCSPEVTINNVLVPALSPCMECADVSVRRAIAHLYLTVTRQAIGEGGADQLGYCPDTALLINEVLTLSKDEDCSVRMLAVASLMALTSRTSSHQEKNKLFARLSGLMEECLPNSLSDGLPDPSIISAAENASISSGNEGSGSPVIVSEYERYMLPLLLGVTCQLGPASPDSFRDGILLPWLLRVTEMNNACPIKSHREKVAKSLYSVLSTLVYYIGDETIEDCVVPALNRLKLDMTEICEDYVKEVDFMLADLRSRIEKRRASISSQDTNDQNSNKSGFMNKLLDIRDSGKTSRNNFSSFFNRKK